MNIEQRIQDLENSVSYLLSEIKGDRLEEMQDEINFLLTQIEGKPKLLNLIDDLRKNNNELSIQRRKLIDEKKSLQDSLSAEKLLTSRLQTKLNNIFCALDLE